MALTTQRIIGQQLTIKIGDSITKWREISVVINESTDDAQGSDEYEEGVVRVGGHIEIKVTGFLGAVNNGATLPMPGDEILPADLSIAVGADTVLPVLTQYTNIKVVAPINYNFTKGAATFEFNARSAVLN